MDMNTSKKSNLIHASGPPGAVRGKKSCCSCDGIGSVQEMVMMLGGRANVHAGRMQWSPDQGCTKGEFC